MDNYSIYQLFDHHQELLESSAIIPEVAQQRGYRSVASTTELARYGFADYQRRVPTLLIPVWDVHGQIVLHQSRPDKPRFNKDDKAMKYETPVGSRLTIDVPPASRPNLGNPNVPLIITEAPRKADAAVSTGACCIDVLGVWGWRGPNEHGGKTVRSHFELIALNGRDVFLAFDSDVGTNPQVHNAVERLGEFIKTRGAKVRYTHLQPDEHGNKVGLDDYLGRGGSLDELLAGATSDLAPVDRPTWEIPIPITEREVPEFPVAALPPQMGAFVDAVATSTQTPADLAAVISLGCVSTALAGKVEVKVSHEWSEPVNLYSACFLGSGNRKTAVYRHMTSSIYEYEQERAREDQQEYARWESCRAIREQSLKEIQKKAAMADAAGRSDLELTAETEAIELAQDRPPRVTRLLVDDATPEKLASLMAEQGGVMALMSAEGGFIGNFAGRYADRAPNYDVLLRGHAGDPIRIDRVSRGSEYIHHPALTICLCAQPVVLDDLGAVGGFRDKGGLARFLFSLPKSLVGYRQIAVPEVPHQLRQQWDSALLTLLALGPSDKYDVDGNRRPHELDVTPGALQVLHDLMRRLEPRLGPHGDLFHIADWGSKVAGQTVRIAALLHVFDRATTPFSFDEPIDHDAMNQAIKITEDYFLPHALAAFDQAGANPTTRHALQILSRLDPGTEISRRDLFRSTKGIVKTLTALDQALELLRDHGYVCIESMKTGGRPSTIIRANPYNPAAYPRVQDQYGYKERNRQTEQSFGTSAHSVRPDEAKTIEMLGADNTEFLEVL